MIENVLLTSVAAAVLYSESWFSYVPIQFSIRFWKWKNYKLSKIHFCQTGPLPFSIAHKNIDLKSCKSFKKGFAHKPFDYLLRNYFLTWFESQVPFQLSNYFKMGHTSFQKWENTENHKCLYYKVYFTIWIFYGSLFPAQASLL